MRSQAIHGNLTHFDLSKAEFLGKTYVYFDPVYHWQLDTERYHFQFYDTPEPEREMRKVDFFIKSNGKAGSWYGAPFPRVIVAMVAVTQGMAMAGQQDHA